MEMIVTSRSRGVRPCQGMVNYYYWWAFNRRHSVQCHVISIQPVDCCNNDCIRTFRSPVFSLLGAKVPSGNLHSQERKFPGTFVPGNEGSHWDILFPGANVPRNLHSWYSQFASDHSKGCWHCSESESKKYSKMNAKNTNLHYCWIRLRTFAHC